MFSLKFPGPGLPQLGHHHISSLTLCQVILASAILTQNKYCIALSTFWLVLQYCHQFTATE
ncbi:hypothetical protein DVA76_18720 [Acinetobacter baumannii]|nr:hypothetical protein DVA76_18720 [Acinetobacter baumannii]